MAYGGTTPDDQLTEVETTDDMAAELGSAAFQLPFPVRVANQEVGAVTQGHLAWLKRFGLLHSEEATHSYLRQQLPWLSMMLYAQATGARVAIAADLIGWIIFQDDLHDGPTGRTSRDAVAFNRVLFDLTLDVPGTPSPSPHPLHLAWVDLWRRATAGRSETWQQRAAGSWRTWFSVYLAEATWRERGTRLPLESFLPFRRHSFGRDLFIDFVEAALDLDVPPGILDTVQMKTLRDVAFDLSAWPHEVYGLAADVARGESHNLVLLLERERGCGRADAVAEIVRMHRAQIARWQDLRAEMPTVYDAFHLDEPTRATIERYIAGIEDLVAGNWCWHHRLAGDGRFHADVLQPTTDGLPAYLHDMGIA